jgi:adenylate cyclase
VPSDVERYLSSQSVPAARIDEAEDGGWLPLLLLDQTLFPGSPRFGSEEVAAQAGVDPEVARTLWRAMGFSENTEGGPAYFPEDAAALAYAGQELAAGDNLETVVRQTRIMNAAVSRIAESLGDEVVQALRSLREQGVSDDVAAAQIRRSLDVDQFERLLGYFLRRHLRDALWRKLAVPADQLGQASLTVGFVDLVRFTAITEEVAEDELDALVTRFGDVAHERITDGGGRMVKMIGDEVMFVADDTRHGAAIALDLVDAYSADEKLPPARAGLACGDVLSRDGDYYGPVVNLASRIVDVARPNAVVGSEALHEALAGAEDLLWRRLPPKRLKGIGLVRLWSMRRAV